MKKTVQVVFLHTNDIPAIGQLYTAMGYFIRHSREWENRDKWGAHLYFVSNEEVKDGEWYLGNAFNPDKPVQRMARPNDNPVIADKIIATTDRSLNLPLIPKKFVDIYVHFNGDVKQVLWEDETNSLSFIRGNTNFIYSQEASISVRVTVEEAAKEWVKDYCSIPSSEYTLELMQFKVKEAFEAGADWQKNQS